MPKNYKRKYKAKAKKVPKAIKSYVKKTIEHETEDKFLSLDNQTTVTTNAGTVNLLNGMVVGTTVGTRLGNKVRLVGLQMRFVATAAIATNVNWFRIILIADKQANAAIPGVANILQTATAAFRPFSTFNPDVVPSRYTILYDRTHRIDIEGGSTDVPKNLFIKINKYSWKKNPLLVQYNGNNTGLITDINKNSIYLLTYSPSAVGVSLNWQSMLYYDDA